MNIVIVDTSPSQFWRFPQKLLNKLTKDSDQVNYTIINNISDLKHSLSSCDYIIAFSFPKIFIKNNKNLKEILFLCSGIPSSFTKDTSYKVATLSGINAKSVAGHCLYLMLKYLRADIPTLELIPKCIGRQSIGIMGNGAISGELYNMLAPLTHVKVITRQKKSSKNFYNYEQRTQFYKDLDFVFITTALNDETKELFSQENFFSKLSPKCVIINIARGELIREDLMISHLDKHPDSFYLTDVTHPEPYPENGILNNHKQVLITKHIAGTYHGVWNDIEDLIIKKVATWKK